MFRICFDCGESTDETSHVIKRRTMQIYVLSTILGTVLIVQLRINRRGEVRMRKDGCFRGIPARTTREHETTVISNVLVFYSYHFEIFFSFFFFFFFIVFNHVDIFQRKRVVDIFQRKRVAYITIFVFFLGDALLLLFYSAITHNEL